MTHMNDHTNVLDRKTATRIRLINWSKFQDVTFHLGGSTLITGVNGTGKSTILDAMTYLLTGNNRFNIAAGDKDRTVKSYVRGDTKSEGEYRYLRTGAVTSYIVMEFWSPIEKTYITGGVCIESMNEQDVKTGAWFIMKDSRLEDFEFSYVKEGKYYTHSKSNLLYKGRRIKGKDFKGEEKGTEQLLRSLGLRCNVAKYRSKLVKMMAFKPERDIDKFIREAVLDPGKITSLSEIKEQKTQFEEIRRIYNELEEGKKKLEELEEKTSVYEKKRDICEIRKLVYSYQHIPVTEESIDKCNKKIEYQSLKIKELNIEKKQLEKEQRLAIERYSASVNNSIYTDMKKLLEVYEKQIQEYKNEIAKVEDEIVKLKQLKDSFSRIKNIISLDTSEEDALMQIDVAKTDTEKAINALNNLRKAVDKCDKELNKDCVHLEDEAKKLDEEKSEVSQIIRELKNEIITYPIDAVKAKEILIEEFKKNGIQVGRDVEVRFLAELVSEVKDLRWQKAVETFLGNKRFYIIVDSKYAYEAMKILRNKKIYNATVAMTNKLPDSDVTPGSAASLLVVPNLDARKYINYLLNGIHLCESLEELNNYPKGGMTRDGMLAKSYAVRLMDMRNTVPYMGKTAITDQLKVNEKKLNTIEERIKKNNSENEVAETKRDRIKKILLIIGQEYDMTAPARQEELYERKNALVDKINSIKNDPSFEEALKEQQAAQRELDEINKKINNNSSRVGSSENEIKKCKEELKNHEFSLKNYISDFEESIRDKTELRTRVEQEYKKLRKEDGEAVSYKNLNSVENDMRRACENMENVQIEYCHIVGLDVSKRGPSFIPFYRSEYKNTANVKIEEAKTQLDKKAKELESAFMIDFVGEINENIQKAEEEMNIINAELKKLPFGNDTYKFIKTEKSDRVVFFKIKRKLKDYFDNPENYMNSNRDDEEMEQYIKEYMDIILMEEDEEEYTDYRKYFTYDMIITSKQGDNTIEANLSKKQGSASNGEKQTPYFIILAASLMQFYHEKCCERLAFIDEAFSALSRERIEQMVKYLEDNHFQVIYAAPPEKIGSIGEHITSTVSLINSGRYTKVVDGSVIFKSNEG